MVVHRKGMDLEVHGDVNASPLFKSDSINTYIGK